MGFECLRVPNLKVNVLTLKIHQGVKMEGQFALIISLILNLNQ